MTRNHERRREAGGPSEEGATPTRERPRRDQSTDAQPSVADQEHPTVDLAFLFTDIESSTPLWEQFPDRMAAAAGLLDEIVTSAVERAGGEVIGRSGDAIDAAFGRIEAAADAATQAQRALQQADWGEFGTLRARMGIDAGSVARRGERYYGPPLNRLGRILAAGHGGQILVSEAARARLSGSGEFRLTPLGEYRFKGIGRPQAVFQLVVADLPHEFPPLRVGGSGMNGSAGGASGSIRGYELREELGAGDFGVVYLAYQASVGRHVAIKIIRPEHANRPDFVRRFEAEAQFVAQLEHPHIVTLYDFWRDPDGAYLVMSYLRAGSVAAALRRGPWRPEPALRLLEQVGSALSFAHRHGVVHRDLKPANILLDEDGNAYLSDFGIAARPSQRGDRPMRSSLAYLPPEELSGAEPDARSDIFSLGVLTFELLTGTAPTGRDLPALIRARADLPAPLANALSGATHREIDRRPASVEQLLAAIRPLLVHKAEDRPAGPEPPAAPLRNPYKGLRAFGEADAADFHGRSVLVDQLLAAVAGRRLVAVVGPSGSGKSSAVRAGLIPALRGGRGAPPGGWLVTEMYPGSYPFEELEAALLRIAAEDPGDVAATVRGDERGLLRITKRILPDDESELVLVIDQFEELFSLVDDDETRHLFLAALSTLITDERSRVRVVATIRADFFDRPLAHPGFGDLFAASLVAVTPPTEVELEQAVTQPALNVGLELEPGLVAAIVADVHAQPGGLPLLQYALTELFERRDGNRLTIASYRDAGGVSGALARRADAVYESLPDEVRATARQVFLRLVTLAEGSEDTRRRVARRELLQLPGNARSVEQVLDAFGAHRLLSFDRDAGTREPTVEVAHEALLRHWGTLRDWVDGARDDLRQHRRLQQDITQWQEHDEDEAYLLPPERLGAVDSWLSGSSVMLSDPERRYVELSRQRMRELEAAEAERQAREAALERRAVNRLRAVVAVLAVGALVSVGLAGVAFTERERAEEQQAVAEAQRERAEEQQAVAEAQRERAEEQERSARARELAAAALAELSDDPERSILLALEAVSTTRDVDGTVLAEAESALRTSIRSSHLEHRIPTGGGISLAPDGRLATLGVDGMLTVWDPETWEPMVEVDGGQTAVPVRFGDALVSLEPDDASFSPDGDRIAVTDADFRGTIRDAASGDVLVQLAELALRPRYSPGGDVVAAVLLREGVGPTETSAVVGVWDAETGEIVHRLDHGEAVYDYTFSPDGMSLATTTIVGGVASVWKLADGERTWVAEPDAEQPGLLAVTWTPDGEEVVFGGLDGSIVFRAASDGRVQRSFAAHDRPVQGGLALSADGARLVSVGQREALVWDVESGQRLFQLTGHTDVIRDVAISADGTRVYTSSQDGETRIWDVSVEGGVEYAFASALGPPASTWPDFSPDGLHLATSHSDGDVRIIELRTMAEVRRLPTVDGTHMVRYSGDGSRIVTASGTGSPTEWRDELEVWDAQSGERLVSIDGFPAGGWDMAVNHDGSIIAWVAGPVLRIVTDDGEVLLDDPSVGPYGRAAFAPDGRLFVGGAGGGAIIDPRTGEPLMELDDVRFYDAAFAPDGSLITGELGSGFHRRDAETGEPIERLPGSANQPSVAAWGDLVATGHDDGLTVWNVTAEEQRFSLEVPSQLLRVRISPDGRFLLANHSWRGLHLYVLPIEDLLDLAHERVTRSLTDPECQEFLRGPCPDG